MKKKFVNQKKILQHRMLLSILLSLFILCLIFYFRFFYSNWPKEKKNPPIVIAHRGTPSYLPEHTLEGMVLAHSFDVDYIELDVILTKDNEPIIMHDLTLDTTTNAAEIFGNDRRRKDGHFYAIDFYLKEIQLLKIHARDSKSFPRYLGHFSIPTLQQAIDLVTGLNITRNKKINLFIEVKSSVFHKKEGHDLLEVMWNLLSKIYSSSFLIIQSFDPYDLKFFKDKKAVWKRVQLLGENSWNEVPGVNYDEMRTEKGMKEIALYAHGIGVQIESILEMGPISKEDASNKRVPVPKYKESNHKTLVDLAHDHDLLVYAYTARKNRLPVIQGQAAVHSFHDLLTRLFETHGVDGIFTDDADIKNTHLLSNK